MYLRFSRAIEPLHLLPLILSHAFEGVWGLFKPVSRVTDRFPSSGTD